jgi:hypothetical protein
MKLKNNIYYHTVYFIICFTLFIRNNYARSFYFSIKGNDSYSIDQAQNPETPWAGLAKISSLKLMPGDSILLERGDIFYGSLLISAAGTKKMPVVIGAYGEGQNPVISGAVSLIAWTQVSSGIWSASLPSTPGYVFQGNKVLPVSKYPNDYLVVDSVLSLTSFSVNGTVDQSWVGATVAVQFVNWAMGIQRIVNINANVITLESPPQSGSVTSGITYISKGRNFYISNHVSLFINNGDWAYDSLQNILYIKSIGYPDSIEASYNQTGINIKGSKNIIVQDINIEKAAVNGIEITSNSSSIYLKNINTSFTGNAGIVAIAADSIFINNCNIKYSGIYGIFMNSNDSYIGNCSISNIGLNWEIIYPFSEDQSIGIGLYCSGNNSDLSANIIDSTGYNGITFIGKQSTIYNNRITNYCLELVDGGGIYTWGQNSTGIYIHDNFVQQTNFTDPNLLIEGIYLDDENLKCKVENNTSIGNRAGIFLHNVYQDIIINNKILNPLLAGIYCQNIGYTNIPVGGNEIIGNDITITGAGAYYIGILQDSISQNIGIIDRNIYKSSNSGTCFLIQENTTGKNYHYMLDIWQKNGYDENSSIK